MNRLIIYFVFGFILSNCNRSILQVQSANLIRDSEELVCLLEFTNKSRDTLFLPKRLIITPNKDNTLNGVIKLYQGAKILENEKIRSTLFDYSIPLDYVIEGLTKDREYKVILLPSDTYIYNVDFTPFYSNLSPGKYLVEIQLFNILDEFQPFDQKVYDKFYIKIVPSTTGDN